MKTTSLSDFRRNIASAIDSLENDREPLLITRGKGKSPAVLLSLEDFSSYEETRYLLLSSKNSNRLKEAILDLEEGDGIERSLIE